MAITIDIYYPCAIIFIYLLWEAHMKNKEKNTKCSKLNYDQLIALMNVYESEFEHRDTILFSRMFKLFYISFLTKTINHLSGLVYAHISYIHE